MVFKLGKEDYIPSVFIPFFILLLSFSGSYGQTAYEVALNMFDKTRQIKSLSYTMAKKERIDGEIILQVSAVKLARNPLKVYSCQKSPKKGLEVLYCEGDNDNKAFVNPGGFPWFTLKLDPMGSIMRSNQHHTILNSGYDYVVSILEFLIEKYGPESETLITYLPAESWQNIPCDVIEFNNPYFDYIEHIVKKDETLISIARQFKLSEYMILQINEGVDDYDDVSPGQVINIPNDYSPRLIIYIDKIRSIPLMMKIYDDKGIYEIYEYYDVIVNPRFDRNEFTLEFKEYDF